MAESGLAASCGDDGDDDDDGGWDLRLRFALL